MKNSGFEFKDEVLYKILAVLIIIFISIMVILTFKNKNQDEINKNSLRLSTISVLSQHYSGTVSHKDYDKSNHNNPTIYLTNGTKIIEDDYWNIIKSGDSLIKKKNEYDITVFRNDSTFKLDKKIYLKDVFK